MTLPLSSPATQRVAFGQSRLRIPEWPDTLTEFQADGPPVGLVDVSASPLPSTAAHKVVVAQDKPSTRKAPVLLDCQSPPMGFIVVSMPPASPRSRAVQNVALTHLSSVALPGPPGPLTRCQAGRPPAGFVE